ncbi:MAG: hypothetical protein IT303_10100 [Dehalococcoidia bacterium]|nr:hypothetical protein [Dehalococcoidia bacterium]
MAMMSKNCGRCSGNTYIEDDLFTRDIVCLQCGARQTLARPKRVVAVNPFDQDELAA